MPVVRLFRYYTNLLRNRRFQSTMTKALVILSEGAEEMETVISVDVLRRGGVTFLFKLPPFEFFFVHPQLSPIMQSRACYGFVPFFLSLYTAIHPLGHSRQVYIVHSGLQDEDLQVTISNYHRVLLPAQDSNPRPPACKSGASINIRRLFKSENTRIILASACPILDLQTVNLLVRYWMTSQTPLEWL